MLRILIPSFLFVVLQVYAGSVKGLLAIPASDDWVSYHSPIPGVELVMVKNKTDKTENHQDNITLVRDQTASLYRNLDLYVDDAIKKTKLIKTTLESKLKKKTDRLGDYYVIESRQQDGHPIVQAVFYKPGLGFYVLTGNFSPKNKSAYSKEFFKMIEGAYFR